MHGITLAVAMIWATCSTSSRLKGLSTVAMVSTIVFFVAVTIGVHSDAATV